MKFTSKRRMIVVVASLALVVGLVAGTTSSGAKSGKSTKKQTIAQIASGSKQFDTLTSLLSKAGLVETLNGKGPFTVFAPTNEAFGMLPPGTVQNLVKPENKAMLTKVLTYHVVPGDYDTTKLRAMILAGNGTAMLTTVEGEKLSLMMNGSSNILVKDAKGDVADITIADVQQSNGVIHVIDRVLMP